MHSLSDLIEHIFSQGFGHLINSSYFNITLIMLNKCKKKFLVSTFLTYCNWCKLIRAEQTNAQCLNKYFSSGRVRFSLCRMLPKSADNLSHSKEHHKGLSYCKTPEIFDHPLTSPPYPKRGPDLSCPRTSIPLFGIWVQLHGLSAWWVECVCQGNNIWQGCTRGPSGDLEFTVESWTVGGNLSHVRGMAAFRYGAAIEQAHQNAALGR